MTTDSHSQLPSEDPSKNLTLGHSDFQLVVMSVCHLIDSNTDLLVLLAQRPLNSPDRSDVIVKLSAERASLRLLHQRLTGDQG